LVFANRRKRLQQLGGSRGGDGITPMGAGRRQELEGSIGRRVYGRAGAHQHEGDSSCPHRGSHRSLTHSAPTAFLHNHKITLLPAAEPGKIDHALNQKTDGALAAGASLPDYLVGSPRDCEVTKFLLDYVDVERMPWMTALAA
jgi:hypothetical protein